MITGKVVRFDEGRGYGFSGTQVQFNIVDGGRGPKAYDVRVVATGTPVEEDVVEEGCEVFSEKEFTAQVTELLLGSVPQLTGGQVLELRRQLLQFARRNGWVD
jgi:CspA family cold shock protein